MTTLRKFLLGALMLCVSGLGNTYLYVPPGAGAPPSGVAGGDLTGSYPNPSVISFSGDSISFAGTAGAGFAGFLAQSATPSTPASGFRLFADNTNRLAWVGANGFVRTFDGTGITANRVYVLPDLAGTVVVTDSTPQFAGVTINNGSLSQTGTVTGTAYAQITTGIIASTTTTNQYGQRNNVSFTPAGASLSSITGFENVFSISTPTVTPGMTIATVDGMSGRVLTGAGFTGTVTAMNMFRAVAPSINAANSVVNYRSFVADDTSAGTTLNQGFRGRMTAGTGKANLYMDGNANNILLGNTRIGATTVPVNTLDVTGNASFSTGIVGTTTNDSAAAGAVGEYVESRVAIGSPVSLTTATAANITSISLTAGDWDVSGVGTFTATSATTLVSNAKVVGISTTSATIPTDGSSGYANVASSVQSWIASGTPAPVRLSLSGTTTVYLTCQAAFSAGTIGAFGMISARRVR